MSFQTATLTGTYQLPDGTPARGTVTIIPNSKVIVDLAGNIIRTGRTTVQLDGSGHFAATVIATDDASLEPSTGRQYTILVTLHDSRTAVPKLEGITLLHGQTYDTADLTTGVVAVATYSAFFNEQDLADLHAADTTNASAITAEASSRAQGDAATLAAAATDAASKVSAETTRATAAEVALQNGTNATFEARQAAAYVARGSGSVALDTDSVPYWDTTGIDFANAKPVLADTDGVPYVSIGA